MSARLILAACMMTIAFGAHAAPQAQIGSWVLSCPRDTSCLLHFEKRFLDKAGLTSELEILADGKSLVPVLALRGLSTELMLTAAMAGSVEAWMQLDAGPREALECAANSGGYFCTPRGDAARNLAASLPAARTLSLLVTVTVSGMKPLPIQQKSLTLTGTPLALAKLRAAGPEPVPDPTVAAASRLMPPASPGALAGMADKALKAAGYPNGVTDLRGLVAKYLKK